MANSPHEATISAGTESISEGSSGDENPTDLDLLLREMMELEDKYGAVFKQDGAAANTRSLWTPIWESFSSPKEFNNLVRMIDKSKVAL